MTTGKALIVGDYYTLSRDQERFLQSSGIEITHVSAEEAPALVLQDTFDVVIAGVTMSGPDLTAIIRQLFKLDPEMPIILFADDLRLREAYELGEELAYDCIPRSVDNGWLTHKLKLAMLQRRLLLENRALSLSTPEPAPQEQEEYRPEEAVPNGRPGEMYQNSERRVILDALAQTRWNRRKAARLLGISYNTLRRRIDRYDLNTSSSGQ